MTAQAPALVCERQYAVLRRGDLDARDRAICAAVWRAWADEATICYRDIALWTGISTPNLNYRITGHTPQDRRVGGGLVSQGWLRKDGPEGLASRRRNLIPGPRFAGLDHGWPLEVST